MSKHEASKLGRQYVIENIDELIEQQLFSEEDVQENNPYRAKSFQKNNNYYYGEESPKKVEEDSIAPDLNSKPLGVAGGSGAYSIKQECGKTYAEIKKYLSKKDKYNEEIPDLEGPPTTGYAKASISEKKKKE